MAVSERLTGWLDGAKVKYSTMKHPVVYTAQEIAAAQHVPGRQLAKCVLVKTDRGPVLAVLPAVHLIDLKKLKALLGAKTVAIAKEADIKERFPDVEVGAMSPFGNLYQVPVVVDRAWEDSDEVVFNAGSHTDTIKMRYQEMVALITPKLGAFGQPVAGPKPQKKGRARAGAKRRTSRPVAKRRGTATPALKKRAKRR